MHDRTFQPWTKPFSVSEAFTQDREVAISATPEECAQLARFSGLESLSQVQASFLLSRRGRERIKVLGEVRARGKQVCGVTLDVFEVEIVEPIDLDFSAVAPKKRKHPAQPDEDREGPEPIIDGKIDLGAVAREFLCLGVDPYPKKPGAVFNDREGQD